MFQVKTEYQEIFKTSWQLAVLRRYRKLLVYTFIPALFTTTFSIAIYSLRGFQYWTELIAGNSFLSAFLYGLQTIFGFLGENLAIGVALFIFGFLFSLGYLFLPLYAQGALIKLIPMILRHEDCKFRTGVFFANQYFLKLFQLRAVLSPFRLSWIFLGYWLLRTFNPEALTIFSVPLLLWFITSAIVNLMLLFSEYNIVQKDMGVSESVAQSVHMVFMNLERVAMLLYLSALVGLRVILNSALIFGIPLLILFTGGYFAGSFSPAIALTIGLIIGLAGMILLSYIVAIMHVFTTSCWTMLFLKFDKESAPKEVETEENTLSEETLLNIAKAHEALLKATMGKAYVKIEEHTKQEQATAKAQKEKTIDVDLNIQEELESLYTSKSSKQNTV